MSNSFAISLDKNVMLVLLDCFLLQFNFHNLFKLFYEINLIVLLVQLSLNFKINSPQVLFKVSQCKHFPGFDNSSSQTLLVKLVSKRTMELPPLLLVRGILFQLLKVVALQVQQVHSSFILLGSRDFISNEFIPRLSCIVNV